jgi:hypothetical protein
MGGILLLSLLWRLDIELGTLLLALQQHIDLIGTPLLTFERAMIPELGLLLGKPQLGPTLPAQFYGPRLLPPLAPYHFMG